MPKLTNVANMDQAPAGSSTRRRILLLIDSLAGGGAQRQICELACALHEAGLEVVLLTYRDDAFFLPLVEGRIHLLCLRPMWFGKRAIAVCRAIKNHRPDVVISYLESPNIYAEFAAVVVGGFKLIVSERNLDLKPRSLPVLIKTLMHLAADVVVANSHTQTATLKLAAPWLRARLRTIPNMVDLQRFREASIARRENEPLRVLIVARYEPQKNGERLVAALRILKSEGMSEQRLHVTWHGYYYDENISGGEPNYRMRLERLAREQGVESMLQFMPPAVDVDRLYPQFPVLCLPSLYEGCSNVIAEAMACGRPVLASRIGDNVRFVMEGRNGWLFDPTKPQEIAAAFARATKTQSTKLSEMGRVSRTIAQSEFGIQPFVEAYIKEIDG